MVRWKKKKKNQSMCVQFSKIVFWRFEKSPWEHISKIYFIFEIISYIVFKVVITKFSWKFTMFQKSFYMFKALKKSMLTSDFFVSKVFFPYQMFTNHFNLFVNFSIFHKKGSMCLKHLKNKNTCIYLFRFWYLNVLKHYYSFEFVFMVQNNVINLIIM